MGVYADALRKKLDAVIERAAKALILEIARELKRSTPVDTGHARANWIPSVGSPNATESPGSDGGLAASGQAAVIGYRLAGGKLYLTNVVRYVRKLNEGSSQKAPALFVEASIARGVATVRAKTGVAFDVQVES